MKSVIGLVLLCICGVIAPGDTADAASWSNTQAEWRYSVTNGQTYCSTCTDIGVFRRGVDYVSRASVGFVIPTEPFTKARLVIPVRNGIGPASTTASVNVTYDRFASVAIEGNIGWLQMNTLGVWNKLGPAQRVQGTWKAAPTKSVPYGVSTMTIALNAKTVEDMNLRLGEEAGFGVWLDQKRVEVVDVYGEDPHFVNELDGISNVNWLTQCDATVKLGCPTLQVYR
jgi:hypothetical protein